MQEGCRKRKKIVGFLAKSGNIVPCKYIAGLSRRYWARTESGSIPKFWYEECVCASPQFNLCILESREYVLTYTVLRHLEDHMYHPYKSTYTATHIPSSPLHNFSPPYLSFRRTTRPCLLVNLHAINQPVRFRKRTRQQLRMRITRCRRIRTIAHPPHIVRARPLPTKRGIEDDIHVGEMLIDIAVAGIVGHWCAPAARVGGAGCDVAGN